MGHDGRGWLPIAENNPFLAGGFVWTGFDYRGEPTPFNRWPQLASQFGIMDSCGFPKDNWFYYRAWWSEAPAAAPLPALELGGERRPGRSMCGAIPISTGSNSF